MENENYFEEEESAAEQNLHQAIIELYLSVKVRNHHESDSLTESKVGEERSNLSEVDSFTILDYIRNSFDILMSMKVDETRKSTRHSDKSENNDLEKMLQKLEGDVRQHIRVEQQLKLHIESI